MHRFACSSQSSMQMAMQPSHGSSRAGWQLGQLDEHCSTSEFEVKIDQEIEV